METIYYTREAYAVLNTLIEAGHEMELNMLLEKANVNFLIAPTPSGAGNSLSYGEWRAVFPRQRGLPSAQA